jgi:hypothetical protein
MHVHFQRLVTAGDKRLARPLTIFPLPKLEDPGGSEESARMRYQALPPSALFSTFHRISVAERSPSFLDRVKMCVKPMAQPILCRSRQL